MFINCTYCKGNKVTTPMGGIEKKCIECNGIGYLECVTDTSTKKGKAEALLSKITVKRIGAEVTDV